MEYGAIDLHKRESQIRILLQGGAIVDRRIATTRERVLSQIAAEWLRPDGRTLHAARS